MDTMMQAIPLEHSTRLSHKQLCHEWTRYNYKTALPIMLLDSERLTPLIIYKAHA